MIISMARRRSSELFRSRFRCPLSLPPSHQRPRQCKLTTSQKESLPQTSTPKTKSQPPPPPSPHHNKNMNESMIIPKSLAIGSFAGLCGSLAGMGGGFVMIPLMTSRHLLNLGQHQAHGTSLFAVAATGIAGALGYQGQVCWDAAAAIAICGSVTAGLGAATTTKLSATTLQRALGIFMIAVAPLVPAKGYFLAEKQQQEQQQKGGEIKDEDNVSKPSSTWMDTAGRLIPPACIGLGSGFLAGLFGVGFDYSKQSCHCLRLDHHLFLLIPHI